MTLGSRSRAPQGGRQRDEIAQSWARSYRSGLNRSGRPEPRICDPDAQDDQLARAAEPVLNELARKVVPVGGSLILVDAGGSVLARHFSDRKMATFSEGIGIVPGAVLTERTAGTNGVSTVLQTRQPLTVVGEEHFFEVLSVVGCYGHPLTDPRTGDFLGVLDLTCEVNSFTELIVPFVAAAASDIQRRFASLGQLQRSSAPASTDRAVVTTLICGESGSGRTTRALVELGGCEYRVFDALDIDDQSEFDWFSRLMSAVKLARPILFENIDQLDERRSARVRRVLFDGVSRLPRVIATAGPAAELSNQSAMLATRFGRMIEIPPLRLHTQDIPTIVANFFLHAFADREIVVDPRVVEILTRHPWRGNIAELYTMLQVVAPTLRQQRFQVSDLPERYRSGLRRSGLSPLERAELEVIEDALNRFNRNKTQAAQFLGITRATLYRKMRYLSLL